MQYILVSARLCKHVKLWQSYDNGAQHWWSQFTSREESIVASTWLLQLRPINVRHFCMLSKLHRSKLFADFVPKWLRQVRLFKFGKIDSTTCSHSNLKQYFNMSSHCRLVNRITTKHILPYLIWYKYYFDMSSYSNLVEEIIATYPSIQFGKTLIPKRP